mmetsp:Transcript_14992/g.32168  ORF Transcript_14992/g.32168 Transcript_14992/m.32168 type:complete len:547 (-) Transcript_14992:206-1846(-)
MCLMARSQRRVHREKAARGWMTWRRSQLQLCAPQACSARVCTSTGSTCTSGFACQRWATRKRLWRTRPTPASRRLRECPNPRRGSCTRPRRCVFRTASKGWWCLVGRTGPKLRCTATCGSLWCLHRAMGAGWTKAVHQVHSTSSKETWLERARRVPTRFSCSTTRCFPMWCWWRAGDGSTRTAPCCSRARASSIRCSVPRCARPTRWTSSCRTFRRTCSKSCCGLSTQESCMCRARVRTIGSSLWTCCAPLIGSNCACCETSAQVRCCRTCASTTRRICARLRTLTERSSSRRTASSSFSAISATFSRPTAGKTCCAPTRPDSRRKSSRFYTKSHARQSASVRGEHPPSSCVCACVRACVRACVCVLLGHDKRGRARDRVARRDLYVNVFDCAAFCDDHVRALDVCGRLERAERLDELEFWIAQQVEPESVLGAPRRLRLGLVCRQSHHVVPFLPQLGEVVVQPAHLLRAAGGVCARVHRHDEAALLRERNQRRALSVFIRRDLVIRHHIAHTKLRSFSRLGLLGRFMRVLPMRALRASFCGSRRF